MYLGSKFKAWWLWVWVGSLKGWWDQGHSLWFKGKYSQRTQEKLQLPCSGGIQRVSQASLSPPRLLMFIFTALVSQASLIPCSPPRSLCIACVACFLQVLLLHEFPIYLLAFDNFAQYKSPWSVFIPWCNCSRSSSVPPIGFGIIFSQLKPWGGDPVSPRPQAMARQVAVPHAQESGNGSHWKGSLELI